MVSIEQHIHARSLDAGTHIGLGVLVASFAIYLFGPLDPLVPPQELVRLWAVPVDRNVAATAAPTGWD
jgi:hypothetical protein